jgi:hypothetical protein
LTCSCPRFEMPELFLRTYSTPHYRLMTSISANPASSSA